jgi:putative membrane-bound dehydrogenase-like protein
MLQGPASPLKSEILQSETMRRLPLLIAAGLLTLTLTRPATAEEPKVHDKRLKLELIAEAPIVRTPTGIAIDRQGRVYVIESHTHFRPNDYDGPQHDRILRFEKRGEKYEASVFFEGTTHTMNCGFHPDGSLFVATRSEVFKLEDKNDNGRIDDGERTRLAHLDTPGNYPHNGLSGFAFDYAGNVYFGFGENLGAAYKLIGSDDTTLSGGGEGGNIYCMRPDGSQLRRVATGFWNPFHLYMDPFGRLFTVDNDPDSRPPCRLIHVVEGGDYGYRFRNGRKGLHPFTSWNGELPGTLPMISGTGEAPSGMIGGSEPILPDLNHNHLIVTSWGDHRIETYRLKRRGGSYTSQTKPLVVGDENFRPVGIAAHPDGSVWFTDWVDKSYELHSKGRLWRLAAVELNQTDVQYRLGIEVAARKIIARQRNAPNPKLLSSLSHFTTPSEVAAEVIGTIDPVLTPQIRLELLQKPTRDDVLSAFVLGGAFGDPPALPEGIDSAVLTDSIQPGEVRYAATRRLDPTKHRERLLELVGDADPFIQQAARWALRTAADDLAAFDFSKETRPGTRLGIALVLREANAAAGQKRLPELLADADPRVRFVAVQWIGEERLKDVWSTVKDDVERRIATRQELEAFFATSAFLSSERYDPGQESRGEEFVAKMLLDRKTTPDRQAFLLRMLRADHPALTEERLQRWFASDNAALRLAALQVISHRGTPPKFLNVGELAQDEARPVEERVEAIGLARPENPNYVPMLAKLASSDNPLIAGQARRTLRLDDAAAAEHGAALRREDRPEAAEIATWLKRLDSLPGDARSGELVFHHQVAQCSRCHEAGGRGAAIGPNLTGIGRTMSRERLIESILQPSKEIAPQFAMWQIQITDGRQFKGMYVDEEVDGTVIYADEHGKLFKIHPRNVDNRVQQRQSIMPEGLAQRLTDQELSDLLAFLSGSGDR